MLHMHLINMLTFVVVLGTSDDEHKEKFCQGHKSIFCSVCQKICVVSCWFSAYVPVFRRDVGDEYVALQCRCLLAHLSLVN